MATVNLGRIKPVFRGAYSGSTAYVVDDIVTSGDETFICIQASTGNATSNASYWTKLAAKGTDGTDVGTTLTTQGDILYRDGSGLQRLGAGTNGQFLKTQGASANPTWGTVTSNLTDIAWLEYQDATGRFQSINGITGVGSGNRIVQHINSTFDPYGIINSLSSNQFTVTSSSAYYVSMYYSNHQTGHFKIFLYNDTDGEYARRPVTNLTSGDNYQSAIIGYSTGQGQNDNNDDVYYLQTGKSYTLRVTNDANGVFSTGTPGDLFGNHSQGGVTSRNCCLRVCLTKMATT